MPDKENALGLSDADLDALYPRFRRIKPTELRKHLQATMVRMIAHKELTLFVTHGTIMVRFGQLAHFVVDRPPRD